MSKNITLNEVDFAHLVQGGTIQLEQHNIALADISYQKMLNFVMDAMSSRNENRVGKTKPVHEDWKE